MAEIQRIAPTLQQQAALLYTWKYWGRPDQFAPVGVDFDTWLILSGRGWGKSRTGSEWVRQQVESGRCKRLALVARTAADARDVMVEGDSGILKISPPWFRPKYEPSKRRLTWPNGAIATTFSADEPNALRGPQYDGAWADELAAWKYDQDAWDQLQFGLRLGANPQVIVTTTPRPTVLVKGLLKDPRTFLTRGSTYDNAGNLAPKFLRKLLDKYEGTRLGRQEIEGLVLEDTPGALWKRSLIEARRLGVGDLLPAMRRIVVAVDPAASSDGDNAETGIVVVGLGVDGIAYVLEDLSGHHEPSDWADLVLSAYDKWKADRVIAEVNNGGALVEANLKAAARAKKRPSPPYTAVHASRGKQTRAEPVATLYEQGKVRHSGAHPYLEDQLCTWAPAEDPRSPDRLDALVWAVTFLMLGTGLAEVPDDDFDDLIPNPAY